LVKTKKGISTSDCTHNQTGEGWPEDLPCMQGGVKIAEHREKLKKALQPIGAAAD